MENIVYLPHTYKYQSEHKNATTYNNTFLSLNLILFVAAHLSLDMLALPPSPLCIKNLTIKGKKKK